MEHGRIVTMLKVIGIILIVLGIAAFVLPSIPFTREEKILDVGPIEAVAEREDRVAIPPVAGIAVLVIGAGLLIAGVTKRT